MPASPSIRDLLILVESAGQGSLAEDTEDALQMDKATVQRNRHHFLFRFPIASGGEIVAGVEVFRDSIYVLDVKAKRIKDRTRAFVPTGTQHKTGFRLGQGGVRRMLAFVLRRVREEYPEVRHIEGERVTGARATRPLAPLARVSVREDGCGNSLTATYRSCVKPHPSRR